jgi:hypothetical protein
MQNVERVLNEQLDRVQGVNCRTTSTHEREQSEALIHEVEVSLGSDSLGLLLYKEVGGTGYKGMLQWSPILTIRPDNAREIGYANEYEKALSQIERALGRTSVRNRLKSAFRLDVLPADET